MCKPFGSIACAYQATGQASQDRGGLDRFSQHSNQVENSYSDDARSLRVRFAEVLVSDVRLRPRTEPDEAKLHFYSEVEIEQFRQDYIAARKAHKKRKAQQNRVAHRMTGDVSKATALKFCQFLSSIFNSLESEYLQEQETCYEEDTLVEIDLQLGSGVICEWDVSCVSNSFS